MDTEGVRKQSSKGKKGKMKKRKVNKFRSEDEKKSLGYISTHLHANTIPLY